MIAAYDWAGGREAMLRFGPGDGPVVIVALPPFEEANRTRSFAVTMLRALAGLGIGGVLPDLPGTGDSLVATVDARLVDWRAAYAAAAATIPLGMAWSVAIRGGALIDGEAPVAGRWRLAPMTGASIVRELTRIRQAAAREDGTIFDAEELVGDGPPVELAGNLIARSLIAKLGAAEPDGHGEIRVVRLESDTQPADHKLPGSPLWRRAEPDNDPALAQLLAADIAGWIATCGG